jgi:hypothetical protein
MPTLNFMKNPHVRICSAILGALACLTLSGCLNSAFHLSPDSYYGKVIDQYGQPVSGVEIKGMIALTQSMDWGDGSGPPMKTGNFSKQPMQTDHFNTRVFTQL